MKLQKFRLVFNQRLPLALQHKTKYLDKKYKNFTFISKTSIN